MGNKLGRRKQIIDEKYTRPQGVHQLRDIDHKKLRKLILDSKLAPCYPGDDDGCTLDLEECPICFLYFPSLNRSKCCTKGICTGCPFCKTSNYAVEYRGAKTKEEKGVEQVEEQRVIEAQIRMRQRELQDEMGKLRKKEEASSSSRSLPLAEVEYQDVPSGSHSARCFRYSTQDDESVSSQGSCSVAISARPSHSRQGREDNIDMDLENIMIMQAIWQSIQEQGIHRPPSSCGLTSNLAASPLFSENSCFNCDSAFPAEPPPPASGLLQCSAHFPSENWTENLEGSNRNRWVMMMDQHGSNAMIEPPNMSYLMDAAPQNFEDQMILNMAVSAAEAGGRSISQELMWL